MSGSRASFTLSVGVVLANSAAIALTAPLGVLFLLAGICLGFGLYSQLANEWPNRFKSGGVQRNPR